MFSEIGEHLVPFEALADGGFLVARAASREALDALLADEPCVKAGKMCFSRVVEFDAAQCQPVLTAWFGKEVRQ
ncbi:YCII-related domain protein [Ralstonia insidiosa]|uniref:YCII-related domain protein n=1 Tax=Ralstonia insidiosa TaxID=190721 RepID=A0AAC9BDF6_9RALS|nr:MULTISPECIES: YciI family protein [Ralstonia]ANH72013.1 YCII-related domain protein [Ralstonia insidiosa]EPX97655.1 hypothetical protein C404_12695 [Ralstonia sp. AU12-08]MBY4703714.1 YciI family protein [Ralstonia insidiosa]GAQ31302.1 hypothetical protein SAMD00023378_4985 [Ralstonia sp. NT80]